MEHFKFHILDELLQHTPTLPCTHIHGQTLAFHSNEMNLTQNTKIEITSLLGAWSKLDSSEDCPFALKGSSDSGHPIP